VDGERVFVLRALNEEDHQECGDRRSGVNDELPGVRKSEERAGGGLRHNNRQRN
jgi:hypothetical protein